MKQILRSRDKQREKEREVERQREKEVERQGERRETKRGNKTQTMGRKCREAERDTEQWTMRGVPLNGLGLQTNHW